MSKQDEDELVDPRSSRKARGLRLLSLRQALQISRPKFGKKLGVSTYAVQNWEIDKNNGLPEERILQIIKVLKQYGVKCSVEWFMHGIEPAPMISDPILGEILLGQSVSESERTDEEHEQSLIAKEIRVFRENYPNQTIDILVPDDGMEPRYIKGEYVAGITATAEQIEKTVGKDCIIQTQEGDIMVRQVRKGNLQGYYTLVCTNQSTTVIKPIIYDTKLLMSAPIIWTRRGKAL